jgi:predicted HicB family RNase H-like nuclease
MAQTKTEIQNRHIKKKYDRHNLFMLKGEKAIYQAAADRAGESLNAYIIKAIQERIKREPP